ncbi:hypothetical protein [Conexibacter sp. SYSU D00693]|uniref:hypothetical protein n=1 Tax=Conexibacter sp. SYSU D00693 TaxID=2812560 RepID=UPI00196AE452|nr:hypothetical protein [Conexibacter sp. SYSU D00693]
MGKRSRKRGAPGEPRPAAVAATTAPRSAPRAPSRRAKLDEAPKAPWSPFPLTELCILIALVLLVVGFLQDGDGRARIILAGVGLLTLAAGELAVREHFAGYRSHTSLLAAICGVVVALPLNLVGGIPRYAVLAVGIAVFAGAFGLLRSAFMARSGGLGFRA